MDLIYATKNPGKVKTMAADLEPFGIHVIQEPLEMPEPQSDEVQEIAESKVRHAFSVVKRPVIVLDAGFYVDALNGFPKAFAHFALDTIGIEGILKLAEGKNRACEFQECLAYMDESISTPKFFTAHIRGRLSDQPKGTLHDGHWSDLALVFIPDGLTTTLAEMSNQELDAWRAKSGAKDPHAKEFPEWFLPHQQT